MQGNMAVSQEEITIPTNLECSICGDIFDKAVSLKACGHTYCSVCIRNHWLVTSRPGVHRQSKKECPLCRTAVGDDVNKALVVNREIQQAVKAFKSASLAPPPSAKSACFANELPIKNRMQSRNYAGMKRNGKKDLIKICKEYNLTSSGNEEELVDRLRAFECMWNAELDTIDTPLRPSELVAKFKKKERMQREAKSRDIMTGKINDSKHLKKMTSSLLDNDNKRNDKTIGETSSGNVMFDVKFKSSFAALIAKGRRDMKKESFTRTANGAGPRIYDDDGIHDSPNRDTNLSEICNDTNVMETTDFSCNEKSLERKRGDESTKTKSPVGNPSSLKKNIYNPYKSERKRKLQDPSVHAMTNDMQPCGPSRQTQYKNMSTTSEGLKSRSSPKEFKIQNPYKKKQLQEHHTSPGAIASHNATRGNFDSRSFPVNSERHLRTSQDSNKKGGDRSPLAQENTVNFTTTNRIIGQKIPQHRSVKTSSLSKEAAITRTTPTPKKKIIRNPYK